MILKNTQQSSFDEIKRSIPSFYNDFPDYMAIQRFVADEMDFFAEQALKIIDNAFILRCDDETIEELERFLGIYDIESRVISRSVYINGVLTSIGKLSVSKLQKLIENAIGEKPEISFVTDEKGNRILHFNFNDGSGNHKILDLLKLIISRLPAHIMTHSTIKENIKNDIYIGMKCVEDKQYMIIPAE